MAMDMVKTDSMQVHFSIAGGIACGAGETPRGWSPHVKEVTCPKCKEWIAQRGRKQPMRYVEALETYKPAPGETSLFLGGGITNCPDWQQEVVKMLADTPLVLLNPRRKNFPIGDPDASYHQIEWEFKHLQMATGIMFWFPCETLCPIVLFEYGKWIDKAKSLFVGYHPYYERRNDIDIQTSLARSSQVVHSSLIDVVAEIKVWAIAVQSMWHELGVGIGD